MRIPTLRQAANWTRYIGIFLAGIIVGSALFMSIYQHNFSLVVIDNISLKSRLDDLSKENESLNKYKSNESVIKSISIYIREGDNAAKLDQVTEDKIKRRVYHDLKILIGQQNANASTLHIVQKLMNRKMYASIQDKDYIVQLQTILVLRTEMKVWLEARPFIRN